MIWNRLTAHEKAGFSEFQSVLKWPSSPKVLAQAMPPLAAGGRCWVVHRDLNHTCLPLQGFTWNDLARAMTRAQEVSA